MLKIMWLPNIDEILRKNEYENHEFKSSDIQSVADLNESLNKT